MRLLIVLLLMFMAGTVFAQETPQSVSLTERIVTLADTKPIVQGLALILGGMSVYVAALFIGAMRQRYLMAWRASLRLAGWFLPLITALILFFMIANTDTVRITPTVSMSVLQLILPLGAAIHTALIFAPEEEPLEMLLALPRPLTWLVFERVLIIVLIYGGLGFMGMGVLAVQKHMGEVGPLIAAWLPAMLFLMSFTLYLTTRARTMTMGLIGAIAVWGIALLFGPFLIPPLAANGPQIPFPMNYIQPFLWTVNLFAQPLSFPSDDYYSLNRVMLMGLSVFWLWRTASQLNDGESMLLSVQDRQVRRKTSVTVATAPKKSIKVSATPITLNVGWQIAAMCLYETKMHWRRRPIKVILLTLLLTTGFALLISYDSLIKMMLPGLQLSDIALDQQQLIKGLAFLKMSLAVLTVMQMLIFPVIMADAVPLDRQDHMDEMLHSVPLPGWAYLIGKVGGMCGASLSAILIAWGLLSVVWFLAVGVYDPRPIIDGWILLSVPTVLFNGGVAVLIGATQPSRRCAVIAVIGVFFLSAYIGTRVTDGLIGALQLNPFNTALLINAFGQNTQYPVTYASLFTLEGVADYLVGRGVIFIITAFLVGIGWTWHWSGRPITAKSLSIGGKSA